MAEFGFFGCKQQKQNSGFLYLKSVFFFIIIINFFFFFNKHILFTYDIHNGVCLQGWKVHSLDIKKEKYSHLQKQV